MSEVLLKLPPEALLHGIGGDVGLRLQIDVSGRVTSAEQISGSELFHETALRTAYGLQFEPAMRDGEPVASEITLQFHYGIPDQQPVFEMVIEHQDLGPPDTRSVSHLESEALERATSLDLAETISSVPGVSLSQGTADASKPIIRGLAERRLLIINDGVRHESQKWGADHAPEVDPHSAGRITIIKGASGVRYGPDALGGVILVEPLRLMEQPGVSGKWTQSLASNGLRGFESLRLDARSERVPHLGFRAEGNYSRAASLSTPDYVLGNTASEVWNAGSTLGYRHGETSLKMRYHRYQQRAGIFYGVQNSSPDELLTQLERGRPLNADLWSRSYVIDRPYQLVSHDLALAHAESPAGDWGHLHLTWAFQRNHRQEFEQARGSVEGSQYEFLLRTHSLEANLEHIPWQRARAQLLGGAGVSGMLQENLYQGFDLIPNYRSLGGGLYAWERASGEQLAVELGGRLDRLSRTAWLTERFFSSHSRRGTLTEESCELADQIARCPSSFSASSLSLGFLWTPPADWLELKLDLSSASRVPNADEAYMLSNAPTFPIYVYSDPELGVETTRGVTPTLGLDLPWVRAEFSGYLNDIEDFIYFAPELDESGSPTYDVTISGTYPRYSFRAIDARFQGAEGMMQLWPDRILGLRIQGAMVRATQRDSGAFLVGIPPDHAELTLLASLMELGRLKENHLELSVEGVAEQTRVDPTVDLAPPPPSYFLLHASWGATLKSRERSWRFGLEGHNLLNQRYRDYTSLLRYYADQPGRDLRAHVSLEF